ncbi:MAG: tRNA (guanosine(46)-N7)-methyltransferase TrmB [Acutalibacteraceae bacterium]|nr:tRNA (guanosine(46)-N7)-methyltransferase TrmB [Acutalibacteraceae bacterium]
MRMRKKKYLDERLEAVSDILFISNLEDRNFNTASKKKEFIDFDNWFHLSSPYMLEIGCGKGGFALEFARRNPNINLIAVEKDANVIVSACEKVKESGIKNVRFIKCSAEYLPKYIKPHSINRIFLNFSCPFPKSKYAAHRLTHPRFLEIYKELMSNGAEIHQKTDNMGLFEFSIESLSGSGFALKNVSLDLHNSSFEGNIETEYEHKFASLGLPIYRLEAYIAGGKADD